MPVERPEPRPPFRTSESSAWTKPCLHSTTGKHEINCFKESKLTKMYMLSVRNSVYQLYLNNIPGGSEGKESACNMGELGSIPELGRSPGEGNGNPLQYSCLKIPWTEGPVRLQSMGRKELDMTEHTHTHTRTHTHTHTHCARAVLAMRSLYAAPPWGQIH